MLALIGAYALTVPLLIAGDLSWLGFLMRDFYQTRLSHLLSPNIHWGAASAFYLLFPAGLFYFAILPAYAKQSLHDAMLAGALYGFFTYATYDLTNMATLSHWPLSITIIDIAWGTFLSAILAAASFWLLGAFSY